MVQFSRYEPDPCDYYKEQKFVWVKRKNNFTTRLHKRLRTRELNEVNKVSYKIKSCIFKCVKCTCFGSEQE